MSSTPLLRPAVRAGSLIAVSGQIGFVDGVLVPGGIEPESAQALANLTGVLGVLESFGLTPSDVVKVNAYLTTMDHYDAMNIQYLQTFVENPPSRTAVAVHELPFGAAIEFEAWALAP